MNFLLPKTDDPCAGARKRPSFVFDIDRTNSTVVTGVPIPRLVAKTRVTQQVLIPETTESDRSLEPV